MSSKNVCSTCNRSFSRLAALENHVRLSHPVNEAVIRAKCLERLPSKKVVAKKASKGTKKSPGNSGCVGSPGNYDVLCGKENTGQRFDDLQESSGPELSGQHVSSRSSITGLPYSTIIDAQTKDSQSQVISQVMSSVSECNSKPQSLPKETSSSSNIISLQTADDRQRSKIAPGIKNEKSHFHFQVKGGAGNKFQSLYEKAKVANSVDGGTSAIRNENLKNRDKNRRVFDVIINDNDGTHYCFACKAYLFSLGSFVNHSCYGVQKGAAGRLCKDCGKGRHECLCGHHVLKVTIEERSVFCEMCKKWFPSEKLMESHDCMARKQIKEENKSCEMEKPQEPLQHDREDRSESTPQNSAVTEDTKNHGAFVKCLYCREVFKDDFQFYNHMLSHKELTHFDCFFCRLVFSSGATLKAHLKSEHDHQMGETRNEVEQIQTESGVRFRCSLCPQTFTCKSNRRRHEHRHFGIRPHKCDLCGASFRQRWQLNSHKSSRRCQENISKLQNLQIKTDVEVLEKIISPCVSGSRMEGNATVDVPSAETAATPTPSSPALLPNIASIPTPNLSTDVSSSSENMCLDKESQCQAGPLDLTNMTATIKQESSRFWCTECGKVCKTKRNLRIHKRIHTGERPYSCTECDLTFRQSHHRKAHMLSRHGMNPSAGRGTGKGEIVVVTDGGIRFKCHICSKVLMSRSGRRKHERWHLGLRPHRCNNCGNMFKQLQHLKKHQRSSNCKSTRPSMMIPSPKKECKSMSDSDFGASRLPLTSQHMLKAARRLRELTPNNNIHTLASDEQKTMDMPLALGLISVEELKVKKEEERKRKAQAKSYVEKENSLNLDEQVAKKIKLERDRSEFSSSCNLSGLIEKLAANVKATVKTEVLSEESSDQEDNDDLEEDISESALHMQDDSKNANEKDVPSNLNTGDSGSGILHGIEEDAEVEKKPVQCLVCGQFYQTKESLQLHMHVHKEDRPYTCTLCPRAFMQPHHLGAHMRSTHHVDKEKASKAGYEEDEGIVTEEGIRFKCRHCSKLLTSRNGRRKHERWHLGLRPYVCNVCGNAFKQSHHLKRHKLGINCIPQGAQEENQSEQKSAPHKVKCPVDDQKSVVDTSLSDNVKPNDLQHSVPNSPVDLVKSKLEVDSVRSEEGNTVVISRYDHKSLERTSPMDLFKPAVGVDSISTDPVRSVDVVKSKMSFYSDTLNESNAPSLVEPTMKVDSIQLDKKRSFIPVTLEANTPLTTCTGSVEDSNGNITTKVGINCPYPSPPSEDAVTIPGNSLVCDETLSDCDSIPQDLSVFSSRN